MAGNKTSSAAGSKRGVSRKVGGVTRSVGTSSPKTAKSMGHRKGSAPC